MAFRTNAELTMVSVTDSGTGNKGFMVDETFFLRAENELLDLLDNNGLLSQTLH